MRLKQCLFIILLSNIIAANAQLSNVRLVDHTNYAINIIEKALNRIGSNCWCNLKVDDVHMDIDEQVLAQNITGEVDLTNGFLVSLESANIIQHTVQQIWVPSSNPISVEVRATMRMMNIAIGFDVIAKMNTGDYRMTAVMRYPEVQYPIVIAQDLFTDEISVTVNSTVISTTNLLTMIPENEASKIVSALFAWNSVSTSINGWATDIIRPVILDLAENEGGFPKICYNCNA